MWKTTLQFNYLENEFSMFTLNTTTKFELNMQIKIKIANMLHVSDTKDWDMTMTRVKSTWCKT